MVTGNDVPACGRMMVVAPVPPNVPIRNIKDIIILHPHFFILYYIPGKNWSPKVFLAYLLLETLLPFLC